MLGERLQQAGDRFRELVGIDVGNHCPVIVEMTLCNGRFKYFFLPCVHTRGLPTVKNTLRPKC